MPEVGKLNVKIGSDINELVNGLEKSKGLLEGVGKQADATAGETQKISDGANGAADGFSSLYGALVAIGATKVLQTMWGELNECVQAAIELESAMAGVAKTTDLDSGELAKMSEDIQALSEEIPLAASEIAGITEAAGQLGISGSKNLLNFTKTMAQLGTATDMSAEMAATMLAQFANITSLPTDEYSNLGATITALGNASATTESKIVEMSQGMAAAATNAGMSEHEILALAAAASSVGIEAAAGSTSWSQLIAKIQTAVETGEDIDAWAAAAGMSIAEFKTAFQTNAAGAVDALITNLGRMDKAGVSMVGTLKDLGVNEVRQQRLVQSLANAEGLLTRELSLSEKAWRENTALNKEAATRYQTTESRAKILDNRLQNLKQTIGNDLAPAYNVLLDAVSSVVKGVDEFAEQNEWLTPVLTGVVAGMTAYVGILAVYTAAKAASNALEKAGVISKTEEAAATAANTASLGAETAATVTNTAAKGAATVAQNALNASMLANPVLLAVAGIAALSAAMFTWISSMNQASSEADGINASMEETAENAKAAQEAFDDELESIKSNARFADNLSRSMLELSKKTDRTASEQKELELGIERLNELYPELELSIDNVNEKLGENSEGIIKNAEAIERQEAIARRKMELDQEIAEMTEQNAAAQDLLTAGYSKLTEEQQKAYDGAVAYAEQLAAQMEQDGLRIEQSAALQTTLLGLDEQTRTLFNDYLTLNGGIAENTAQIETNKEISAGYEEELANMDAAYLLLGNDVDNLSEREREWANGFSEKAVSVSDALADLNKKYDEAYKKAEETLSKEINKWDELKNAADVTVKDITKGYETQAEFLNKYVENKEKLLDRDIAGLKEWVQANDDGSAESGAAFEKLAGASDEQIEKMLKSYEKSNKGQEAMAESMARTATNYDEEFARIMAGADELVESLSQAGKARTAAVETANGLIAGVEASSGRVSGAFRRMAAKAIEAMRAKLEINSPSKVAVRLVGEVAEGFEKGEVKESPRVRSSFSELAEAGVVGMEHSLTSNKVEKMGGLMNSAVLGYRNITNRAGASVNVNVPISVSRELSDYDIKQKARQISAVVEKEMARVSGGRM